LIIESRLFALSAYATFVHISMTSSINASFMKKTKIWPSLFYFI